MNSPKDLNENRALIRKLLSDAAAHRKTLAKELEVHYQFIWDHTHKVMTDEDKFQFELMCFRDGVNINKGEDGD